MANGQSEWITSEKSREAGRRLRAAHDAIAIGSKTAEVDNPQLTTRISGERDPIRIVFDTHSRLSPTSNLALTARQTPVWVLTSAGEDAGAKAAKKTLSDMGVRILNIAPANDNRVDLPTALQILHENGISNLLVEGGGTLAASFIRRGAIDIIEWFRAPLILGGDGRSAVGDLGLEALDLAHHFSRIDMSELGDDVHERYERSA